MFLKSLCIHGFKSFADKTLIEFHKGVTGIVGPNGCGKSNVVDAIRWVLGETSAKALRGDEMADVIFNGTDKRKPLGMAEVILTMADCESSLKVEFNEVSICRRVFRDGRSEYRINNQICRLKDIQELIAGTGIGRTAYSIMAQGQIDMLLSSKPEDRRSVFEEAAGITRFKSQKREALRKLEYTEANLLRVVDILTEVKRQLSSLQRQSSKARRYVNLLEDLRTLETHLGHKHFIDFTNEKNDIEKQIQQIESESSLLQEKLSLTEQDVTQNRESYHSLESQILQYRAQTQHLFQQKQNAESKRHINEERLLDMQQRIETNTQQISQSELTLDRLLIQQDELQQQLDSLSLITQEKQTELDQFLSQFRNIPEEKNLLESQRRELRENIRLSESRAAIAEAKLNNLIQQKEQDEHKIQTLTQDIEESSLLLNLTQTDYDLSSQEQLQIDQTILSLEQDLKLHSEEINITRQQLAETTKAFHIAESLVSQLEARQEILEKLITEGDGLDSSTKHFLEIKQQPQQPLYSKIQGLLADHLHIPPHQQSIAQVILGDFFNHILLQSDTSHIEIKNYIENNHLSRIQFLIPSSTQHSVQTLGIIFKNGILNHDWIPMIDWLEIPTQAKTLLAPLLHNVYIVPDIETAKRAISLEPITAVTHNAEIITANGQFSLGSIQTHLQLERQNELKGVQTQYLTAKDHLQTHHQELHHITEHLQQLENIEAQLRNQISEQRQLSSAQQAKISMQHRLLQQALSKQETFQWEQNQIRLRLEQTQSFTQSLLQEKEIAQSQLNEFNETEQIIENQYHDFLRSELIYAEQQNTIRSAIAIADNNLLNAQRQQQPIIHRQLEIQESISKSQQQNLELSFKIEESQLETSQLLEQIQTLSASIQDIENYIETRADERKNAFEQITQLEASLSSIRQKLSQFNEHHSRADSQLARIELRLEHLLSQAQERYQLHFDEFAPDLTLLNAALEHQRNPRSRSDKRGLLDDTIEFDSLNPTLSDTPEQLETVDSNTEDSVQPINDNNHDEIVYIANDDESSSPDESILHHPQEIEPTPTKDINWDEVSTFVTELRQKIESIGPVNLDAIKEFEEHEARYTFLENQHSDLILSKDELLSVIAKINETTKVMFSETFALVRQYFKDNFTELFGQQSEADLLLSDNEDPLESGIEIIAKPPGKKLQTITLLSGGERSMTAVALLFSIYQVKPSPFCVLDELDAPLDESNISRFLRMLEKFTEQSQFIIVTHNKRTMSHTDVIYGITMQEQGVSKPIGVRISNNNRQEHSRSVVDSLTTTLKETTPSENEVLDQILSKQIPNIKDPALPS